MLAPVLVGSGDALPGEAPRSCLDGAARDKGDTGRRWAVCERLEDAVDGESGNDALGSAVAQGVGVAYEAARGKSWRAMGEKEVAS